MEFKGTVTQSFRTVLVVFAIVAGILVVRLSLRVFDLNDQGAEWTRRATFPHTGTQLPAIATEALSGDSVFIGRPGAGRGQVLFYFSTTCPYCAESVGAWRDLASRFDKDPRVDVIGIATDSTHLLEGFRIERDLPMKIVRLDDPRSIRLLRAGRVPVTLVADSLGRVIYAVPGVLDRSLAVDSLVDAVDWALRESQPFP